MEQEKHSPLSPAAGAHTGGAEQRRGLPTQQTPPATVSEFPRRATFLQKIAKNSKTNKNKIFHLAKKSIKSSQQTRGKKTN